MTAGEGVSRETLAALVARHGLDAAAAERLQRLVEALAAEPHAPTALRAYDEALREHVADGLAALELEDLAGADRLADVGSGAGFPGLVLAAARPAMTVHLIEASGRKAAVAGRLARVAGIANASAVTARAEEWAAVPASAGGGAAAYAAVTARAVAPLATLAEYSAPLLREGGVLVAWKGARDAAEERTAAVAAKLLGMAPEAVVRVTPFPAARRRHLHLLRKVAPTPERFPRRPGMAAKRPLG
jgi:16S rRNA (guanine527-N7)-methyltransferase